jgi:putative N6-adenine-specific DNA methylase
VAKLRSKYNYGYIVCNPPYGERLAEKNDVEILYRQMGEIFKQLDTWSYYVLTSHTRFEKLFNRPASKKRKLYNGRIQCNLYQFFGPKPVALQGPFAKPPQG